MMQVKTDVNTSERYRVFAHVGNGLSDDGVTITLQLLERGASFELEFWTRRDVITFFTDAAHAAAVTQATEEDEMISGAAMVVERVTTSWEEIEGEPGAPDA